MNTNFHLFRNIAIKPGFLILAFTLQALMFSSGVIASDDSYLSELESEAENSGKVQEKTTPKDKKAKKQQDRFEHLLKFERPSTYHFYTKLSIGEKQKVISIFRKNKKLSVASKKIFDLYFEHKQ